MTQYLKLSEVYKNGDDEVIAEIEASMSDDFIAVYEYEEIMRHINMEVKIDEPLQDGFVRL